MKLIWFGDGHAQGVLIIFVLGAIALIMLLALTSAFFPRESDRDTIRYFDRGFLDQAARYHRSNIGVFIVNKLMIWLFYAALTVFTWKFFAVYRPSGPWLVLGFVFLLLAALFLLSFPLDYYRGFVLEHRFGLATTTFANWLGDHAKSAGISLVVSGFSLWVLYLLRNKFTNGWWIVAGLLLSVFLVVSVFLSPLLIDPLFYRFHPLKDEQMRSRIADMATVAGVDLDEVLVADASRKTNKANAYFTGLGGTKRIVIYDTLATRFSEEESLAVIAHEIAHWRYGHVFKGIALGIVGIFSALFILHILAVKLGIGGGDLRIIPLALLFISLLSFVAMPVENAVSRHFERQADQEAVCLTGNPEAHFSLFRNLAHVNLSEVEPHPYIEFLLYSHPPLMERIRALK
ncbi:MAG: M48 family metallopeptidase [Firmicutes bacterium]|nr:M48 family metallopeptidase [Bacillota bacterium]